MDLAHTQQPQNCFVGNHGSRISTTLHTQIAAVYSHTSKELQGNTQRDANHLLQHPAVQQETTPVALLGGA